MITPQRFYELLDNTNDIAIYLWNPALNKYVLCYNIFKHLGCLCVDIGTNEHFSLKSFFENKPLSVYDFIIHHNRGIYSNKELLESIEGEYGDQLKHIYPKESK